MNRVILGYRERVPPLFSGGICETGNMAKQSAAEMHEAGEITYSCRNLGTAS